MHDKEYVPLEKFVFNTQFRQAMKRRHAPQPLQGDISNGHDSEKDDINSSKHGHVRSSHIHHVGQKTTKVRASCKFCCMSWLASHYGSNNINHV